MTGEEIIENLVRTVHHARNLAERRMGHIAKEVQFSFRDFATIELAAGGEINMLCGLPVVPNNLVRDGECFIVTDIGDHGESFL